SFVSLSSYRDRQNLCSSSQLQLYSHLSGLAVAGIFRKAVSLCVRENARAGKFRTTACCDFNTMAPRTVKKTVAKEVDEDKPKETRPKRNKPSNLINKETENDPIEKNIEEKPKGRGRGRKAQLKPNEEISDPLEDVKMEPIEPPVSSKRKAVKIVKDDKEKPSKKKAKASNKAVKNADIEPNEEAEDVEEKHAPGKENDDTEENQNSIEKVPVPNKKKTENVTKKARKGGKKAQAKVENNGDAEDENAKGDSKVEEEMEEEVEEAKPVKSKRGQKKVVEKPSQPQEDVTDTVIPSGKRRRKVADDNAKEPKKLTNKTSTSYESMDFSNTSKNKENKEWNFKISSWNVDGIRAWLNKGGLEFIKFEKPDILCLQEVKCSREKLPEEIASIPGYHTYWLSGVKEGYAGVCIYTTKLAINVQYGLQNEEFDDEGRIITAEYEQFYLVCTYVPNSGRKLVTLPKRLKWNEEFRKHVKALDEKKPVVICGDMNVSHTEIDLANPKTNKRNAGFTQEERDGMSDLLGDGFVDTFRHLYPDKTGAYTFWTYMSNCRSKNVGWRLDYFIVSERFLGAVCDSIIRDQVFGSDHCPITLHLHLSTADKPKE
ncbi:unnamed protein product, partial [Leptidea sinapis]